MTPAQQTAIEHHCRLAGETVHPRFKIYSRDHAAIVTVNSGYE